jgi:hypothetical protein
VIELLEALIRIDSASVRVPAGKGRRAAWTGQRDRHRRVPGALRVAGTVGGTGPPRP